MEDIKLKLRRIIGVLLCLALCLGMLSGCGGETAETERRGWRTGR